MLEEKRSTLEPVGALALALALAGAEAYCKFYNLKDANVVAITSGANMNFDRLRLVTELANVGRQREAVLATFMPEEVGSFKQFTELLFDRIIDKGHYSEREAADLAKTIVSVIEGCHSLGVMHRDLKPENFLFLDDDEDSLMKIIDFGLSIFFKTGQVLMVVVGSPYYVEPEVLNKSYGPEADIWSAGVIIYILLCGVPPF